MIVKPIVYENNTNNWHVALEYDTPIFDAAQELILRHDWAVEILSEWSSVTQLAWGVWEFNNEDTANSFVLLYNLTWH